MLKGGFKLCRGVHIFSVCINKCNLSQAFEQENNAGKNQFISDFKRIWTSNIKSPEMRLQDSIA